MNDAWFRRGNAWFLFVWFVWLAVAGGLCDARDGRSADRQIRRAKPPNTTWEKATAKEFHDDAFAELEGERPDFAASAARPQDAGVGPSARLRWGTPAASNGRHSFRRNR